MGNMVPLPQHGACSRYGEKAERVVEKFFEKVEDKALLERNLYRNTGHWTREKKTCITTLKGTK